MSIRSRSTIFTGIDSTPVLVARDTSLNKTTVRGLGDLTLGAAYVVAPEEFPVEVEFSGRVKFSTASENRLTSGKTDYSLGADVSFPLGKVVPFASVSYRVLGDVDSYALRDGPAASAGASYAINSGTFVLASYHYSQSATRFISDSHELFAGASTRLARTPFRVTAFATKGLSQGAADVAGGVSLSFGLGGRSDAQ
jgi:long-subunit fatty acid transport protein